jgi:hypothetical protein
MKNSASCLFRINCCAALAAILATPAIGASLIGTVSYKTGGVAHAVPEALVMVYHVTTRRKAVTRSNDSGYYAFNVPKGDYVILVEKDGVRVYQGKVEVHDRGTRFDIKLGRSKD